jgi:hypothetical protein
MKTQNDAAQIQVFNGRVDRDNHVIRGVSLMRIGPAKTHDMDVDEMTLQQALAMIPPSGLKAKLNHRDATGILSINGKFKNPRISDGRLRADWHLNPDLDTTARVEALATHQPEDAGISLTCFTRKERIDGKNYMRITGVKSADLVDDPAVNESMFSELSFSEPRPDHLQLRRAADELEAAHGIERVTLAMRFRRELGDNWREEFKLMELEEGAAQEPSETREVDDDSDDETVLEVGDTALMYLETAEEDSVSLAQLEAGRRTLVIQEGQLPNATPDQVFAAGMEMRRRLHPDLVLTGLESIQYSRVAGVPWAFTCQDFSDEKGFVQRAAAIELARQKGSSASPSEVTAALRGLSSPIPVGPGHASIIDASNPSKLKLLLIKMRAAKANLRGLRGIDQAHKIQAYREEFGADWESRLEDLDRKATAVNK